MNVGGECLHTKCSGSWQVTVLRINLFVLTPHNIPGLLNDWIADTFESAALNAQWQRRVGRVLGRWSSSSRLFSKQTDLLDYTAKYNTIDIISLGEARWNSCWSVRCLLLELYWLRWSWNTTVLMETSNGYGVMSNWKGIQALGRYSQRGLFLSTISIWGGIAKFHFLTTNIKQERASWVGSCGIRDIYRQSEK